MGGCRYDSDVSDHVHVSHPDGSMQDAPFSLSEQIVQSIPKSLVDELERTMGVEFARLSVHFEVRPDSESNNRSPD